MFQLNPELSEIIQKYRELLENSQFKEQITTSKYAFGIFLTIAVLYILFCILDAFSDKTENYFLLIASLPLIVAIISWCNSGNIAIQITNSVIQEYTLKHENNNPLQKFDVEWLQALLIDSKIEKSKLFKPKNICDCRLNSNPPSVKYMQIEPAPEGDAPMVETQVVTKNELTKHNSQPIYSDDVQLIKIEKKNDTTLITTHIKINNQWYKTQLQESLLDLILDGETQQYYDNAQGKILVGV